MPVKHNTPTFKAGDKVAYYVHFLISICEQHGSMAQARGVVVDVVPFGSSGRNLVKIDWQGDDMPEKVLDANLAHVGPNCRFCNVD